MEKKITRRQILPNIDNWPNIHPVLQRIYLGRGITGLDEIERDLLHLLPYQQLLNIEATVIHLANAIKHHQRLLIIGDFDADGATSCVVAVTALRSFGATSVNYLVPNRFDFGYGLTPEIVEVAKTFEPDYIITVDNGIANNAGVARANELGIKVIVTDHHLPGKELPDACTIVNPNQAGDQFPSKNLAGVGVIFYVMLALRSYLRAQQWFSQQNIPEPNMSQYLDCVALGTVADVVPLDKNNRILVYQGCQRIQAGKCRPGIKALLAVAGRSHQNLSTSDLGFIIGPRLNAAGRLEDMSLGIECLLCEDYSQALIMAQELNSLNEERRRIETTMKDQALLSLDNLKLTDNCLPLGISIFDESWHQGVIGILAARIKDKFHRPVIAFAVSNDNELKGSARSIKGLHIRDVLAHIDSQFPNLITKFGGHAQAAGLTLPRANFLEFCQAFNDEVTKHVTPEILAHQIISDGELKSEDVSIEVAQLLQDGGPWGQNFPEPTFDGCFKLLEQRSIQGKHLKCWLAPMDSNLRFEAIAFNVDAELWPNFDCQQVKVAYRLDINEYQGNRRIQLMIEHLEVMS